MKPDEEDYILRPDLDENGLRSDMATSDFLIERGRAAAESLHIPESVSSVSREYYKELLDKHKHAALQPLPDTHPSPPDTINKRRLLEELRVLKAKSKFTRMDDVIKLVESM